MDPFAVIILGGTAGLAIALYLLGRVYPGSGSDVLDWKPTRSAETEIQNEIDDLDQMLEAANARRRARGRPELTEDAIRAELAAAQTVDVKHRDEHLADLEIVQMLEIKNKRRRAKGLPEITEAEFRARIEGEQR